MAKAPRTPAGKERKGSRSDEGSSSPGASSPSRVSSSARSTDLGPAASPNRQTAKVRTYDGSHDSGSPKSTKSTASSKSPPSPKLKPKTEPQELPKNVDLGVGSFSLIHGIGKLTKLPPRPAPSKVGSATKIMLNTFHVESLPTTRVYQYDVMIGSGNEKRGLIRKVWDSKAVKSAIGAGWIFDGNKIAWNLKKIDAMSFRVDLDTEEGRKPGKKPNVHLFSIRETSLVRLDQLVLYMEGRTDFDNTCLEAINFLDHVLREFPTLNYTQIKRSFFYKGRERLDLGGGIEAFKGVYQSMRIVHGGKQACVSVNVDVANGTFWTANQLHYAAIALTGRRDINDLIHALSKGEKDASGKRYPAAEQLVKKMRKLRVVTNHRGGTSDEYVIDKFLFKSARDHTFEKDGRKLSIYDYFSQTYNVRLQYPNLPLVQTTKRSVLPMEVCLIKGNQRYPFKLDERQTSSLIRVAAVPPTQRWRDIQNGLEMLKWNQDPVLRHYGLKINMNPTTVDARIIPAPKVQFGSGDAKPGTSGKWDLKGKKFLSTNTTILKSWSVTVIPGRRGGKPDKAVIEHFMTEFIKIYQAHGGRVENKYPHFSLASGDDVSKWVTTAWNDAGNQSGARPQMLVFILPDKTAETYGRIKRSADCRYGVVSQCMQYANVQKAQPQYISNVCMKFNAKLGGQTARAIGPKSGGQTGLFSVPTMVIGADVSHAAPGAQTPSMAAMTVSMDRLGIRYAADCETNGYRVEMIRPANIQRMLRPMITYWMMHVGGNHLPQRVMYFRDGVSDQQCYQVLEQEVNDMKEIFREANAKAKIPFVVIIGSKRHHVRFFPGKAGDRNGNPLPGTLVESGVTSPFENDFYLCSHSAIKGTARPMHYQVLLNEPGLSNEELQTLIYEHCYQYVRSTTPISQHPAIYYAHLASNRAIPHDRMWMGSSNPATTTPAIQPPHPRSGSHSEPKDSHGSSSSKAQQVCPPLLEMANEGGIKTSMWYI